MDKWLKICQDGTMKYVDMPSSKEEPSYPFLDALYKELDCFSIEIVRVTCFDFMFPKGFELIIIIDECGKLKEDWELRINSLCTLGYAPGVDCIVGDAVLGRRIGPDVVPLSQKEYDHFVQCIEEIFSDFRLERGEENARV